jgi:hypothetical protein
MAKPKQNASKATIMASKKQAKKVGKVMHEYKVGTLKSSSGNKVTDIKQAIAIAMSEAKMVKKVKKKKTRGN